MQQVVYVNALINVQDYRLWKDAIHLKRKDYRELLLEIHAKFEILLSKQVGRRGPKFDKMKVILNQNMSDVSVLYSYLKMSICRI